MNNWQRRALDEAIVTGSLLSSAGQAPPELSPGKVGACGTVIFMRLAIDQVATSAERRAGFIAEAQAVREKM